jgi:P-type conjugative transfer protein TrbG
MSSKKKQKFKNLLMIGVAFSMLNAALSFAQDFTPSASTLATPDFENFKAAGQSQIINTNELAENEKTIICAPMRVCLIKLLPSEKIIDQLIGDSSRWEIITSDQKEQSFVAIKPKKPNLQTNYIIIGKLKTYYFNLQSTEYQYMNAVVIKGADVDVEAPKNNPSIQKNISTENIQKNASTYQITGGAEFKPLKVWTDGIKTYIKLPRNLNELPIFIAKTTKGDVKAVNARWLDDQYIIDEKITKGELIRGTGRYQEKIEIELQEGQPQNSNQKIDREIN